MLVPCHVENNHWVLGVVNIPLKKVAVLDSNGGSREKYQWIEKALVDYMVAEYQERRRETVAREDFSHW